MVSSHSLTTMLFKCSQCLIAAPRALHDWPLRLHQHRKDVKNFRHDHSEHKFAEGDNKESAILSANSLAWAS